MDSLFRVEEGEVRSEGPSRHGESTYDYLQRSNRPEVVERCEWMNEWFSHYPDKGKPSLVSRMQSDRPGQFDGAWFELIVHHVLWRLAYRIQIGGTGEPDFIAASPEEGCLYVEATSCLENKHWESSTAAEKEVIATIREAFPTAHSWIWVDRVRGNLSHSLSKKYVVGEVRKLLEVYSLEDVAESDKRNRGADPASWFYERNHHARMKKLIPDYSPPDVKWAGTYLVDGDWVMAVELSPKSIGSPGGYVSGPGGMGVGNGSEVVYEAIREKGKKYGKRFGPLVIAVATQFGGFSEESVSEAVYGRGVENGAFRQDLRRIAGVLEFRYCALGGELTQCTVKLHRNGDAARPDELLALQTERPLGELLGLSPPEQQEGTCTSRTG